VKSFTIHAAFWEQFYFHSAAHDLDLPAKIPDSFNLFHKAVIVKIIRPDKFIRILQQVVTLEMGKQYLEPPPFSLDTCFKESDPITPLIFILSPGADPRNQIHALAEKLEMQNQFIPLSLGQGQQALAEKQIRKGAATGLWILLQNCHVAHSFMP
jgi:dynein heavy chain